jgi:hypothetical protein
MPLLSADSMRAGTMSQRSASGTVPGKAPSTHVVV